MKRADNILVLLWKYVWPRGHPEKISEIKEFPGSLFEDHLIKSLLGLLQASKILISMTRA